MISTLKEKKEFIKVMKREANLLWGWGVWESLSDPGKKGHFERIQRLSKNEVKNGPVARQRKW